MLVFEIVEEIEQGEKVTARVSKPGMQKISLGSFLQGPFSWVLNRETRHDDHHLANQISGSSLEQHSGKSWFDWEPCQLMANLG